MVECCVDPGAASDDHGDMPGASPIGRAPSIGDSDDGEDLSPLGAALIEALREAGEDPSELIKRKERDD